MSQTEFEKIISEFQKLEDARDQLWDRAKVLIEKGFEVEAYVLILATWNFARFRYFMKNFDLRKFQAVIKRVNPVFKKLENTNFENIDFADNAVVIDIKFIYNQLKKIAEQTGASKIMALKNSKLFVMWDTEIRNIYRKKREYKSFKIHNGQKPEDYINFLKIMKAEFGHIRWNSKTKPLAKVIDEYNYVIADRNRGVRKSKIKQK